MIQLIADDEKLKIIVDDSKDQIITEMVTSIRDYLNVAFGWDGPYYADIPAVVAQW